MSKQRLFTFTWLKEVDEKRCLKLGLSRRCRSPIALFRHGSVAPTLPPPPLPPLCTASTPMELLLRVTGMPAGYLEELFERVLGSHFE